MSVPRPAMLVAMVTACALAGLGDDHRLALVLLGVEDVVDHPLLLEQPGESLRLLDAGRAHQHRLPGLVALHDVVHHRLELGRLGLVYEVGLVAPDHRLVGGDGHHLQLVDLVELLRLGDRRCRSCPASLW